MSNNTSNSNCSSNCSNLNVWYCRLKCNGVSNSSSNSNSNKISTQRPLTLLLITMTIMLLTQMPHSSSAAAISARHAEKSALLTSSSEESASAAASASEEDLLPQQLPDLQLDSGIRRRMRIRKRQSHYVYFQNNLHVNSTTLEWENPCNGVYEPTDEPLERRPPVHYYLNELRQNTKTEVLILNETLKEIDISEMDMWRMYKTHYKFLPKLKQNSGIALKRWYRNMQNYVAAFAYLGRSQYKYDKVKHDHITETTKELNELFLSAQKLLCEIETTINGSYPQKSGEKLTTVSRAKMNERLKFLTRVYELHENNQPKHIDLMMAKYYYFEYLDKMSTILCRNGNSEECLPHNSESANTSKTHFLLDSGSASSSESASASGMAKDSVEAAGKGGKRRKNHANGNGSRSGNNKSGRNSSAQGGNRRKKHRHAQRKSAELPAMQ